MLKKFNTQKIIYVLKKSGILKYYIQIIAVSLLSSFSELFLAYEKMILEKLTVVDSKIPQVFSKFQSASNLASSGLKYAKSSLFLDGGFVFIVIVPSLQ